MATVQVVIIGAGVAGLTIAHSLLQGVPRIKVVLINPSQSFYWNVASPRIVAKPDAFRHEQYLLPIKDAFAVYPSSAFELLVGIATAIDVEKKTVAVALNDNVGTHDVPFDHLVIASGSTNSSSTGAMTGRPIPFKPTNRDDIREVIENAQKVIAGAKEIVIGGAGPVGVELAGELAESSANKAAITLISSTDHVLPMLKPSASAMAEKRLQQLGVKILTSVKVGDVQPITEDNSTCSIALSDGTMLSADLFIPTTGAIPNNSFVPKAFLDNDGWVKVDEELRVRSIDGSFLPIYAVGDINTNNMRLSFKATAQAKVAAANLMADIHGEHKRKQYDQGKNLLMLVPVGKTGGTGQIFGFVLFSILVRLTKGRSYFISKASQSVAGKA
ncbi:hypothetical protein N7539_002930 [Penicillium diatomitis]|uniref:FAD/NAD(P)-binding domain-containing protein n=1 Tax=Penicillium diatomitis TaxID=2819901 RepID=A0A9W9XGH8_9EURO|nr:uncharacterized protein N7539_002930 [Penicillium diatomitis]KAJ5491363.1 hypothetical protein N7539_002930 [Penicillium diatomitis]